MNNWQAVRIPGNARYNAIADNPDFGPIYAFDWLMTQRNIDRRAFGDVAGQDTRNALVRQFTPGDATPAPGNETTDDLGLTAGGQSIAPWDWGPPQAYVEGGRLIKGDPRTNKKLKKRDPSFVPVSMLLP